MTIIKLTKSQKAVQIVTDEGFIFQTSVSSLQFLLNGFAKNGFITTMRLPFNVAPDRYKPSEVWTDGGKFSANSTTNIKGSLTASNDSFSVVDRKKNAEKKIYKDVNIDDL